MNRFIPLAGSVLLVALAAMCLSLDAQEKMSAPFVPPAKGLPRQAGEKIGGRIGERTGERGEPPFLAVLRELNSKTDIRVERMPLAKFAELLSEQHKIPFKLDRAGLRRAHVDPNTPITASCVQIPLDVALRRILGRLNLRHEVGNSVVVITGGAQPDANLEPGDTPDLTAMRALRSRTEIHVERMPLEEFAKFLSKKHKIPFRLDRAGLSRAHVARNAPITAEIERAPLSAALQQIFGPLNLAHRVVNGVVLITDRRPNAAPARIVRRRPAQQMQPVFMIQNQRQQVLQLLKPRLQVELLFVKRICAPTKEQFRQLKNELEEYVKDALLGPASNSYKLLQEKLAASVETCLSREQAAHYRSELEKRNANEREVCARNLVVVLDRELCLSAKQREALCASLAAKWDDAWTQTVEMAATQGQNYVPSVPDELIEAHLDAAQTEVWQNMQKIGNVNWGIQAFQMGMLGIRMADPDDD